jgi:beta-xylosidase/lysophospholipase L1-like esterase
MKNKILLCIVALTYLAFDVPPARPVHIFMAGDSTMADKVLYKPVKDPVTGLEVPEAFPERGWGMLLPKLFTEKVVIENYAKNGRSTRTFIEEGLWDKIYKRIKPGDYVVIEFGHNDASPDKVDRYTPPEDYRKNLNKFIDETVEKGGIPILCTPVARRKFGDNGHIVNTHGVYTEIVKEVAQDKKVLFVDMFTLTKDWLDAVGEANSTQFFMHIPAGISKIYPTGLVDNTHYVEAGAIHAAELFTADIERQKVTGLTNYLYKNRPLYKSNVWVSDMGNGKYKNPVLYADYSDPDVCRVGSDYYMTASSFNCIPGLPILHSKDLVNWELIGHAITAMPPTDVYSKPQHGNGVWAPSIRYRNGEFYIYFGDPDYGIYMTKTTDPAGVWEPLTLVKAGKGLIDACPFWDEDNQAYLVHGYAGSRAGIKSMLAITKLTPDGKKAVGESRVVYDGHDLDPTIEGPKMYKKNGYYYIFAPAGGVATGYQLVLRADRIFGVYERKVVMDQGNTDINGPHQGAWVDTKTGEDWFVHFQDKGAFGRVVHLQPMKWINDFPVIGEDKDGDGIGNPVSTYKKPDVGQTYPVVTPVESDEFSKPELGLQWQWNANSQEWWAVCKPAQGVLSLYSVPAPANYNSLWDVPNLLLQKLPAPEFTATAKVAFSSNLKGERAGIVVMGMDYGVLAIENTGKGLQLVQSECKQADKGGKEQITKTVAWNKSNTLYLRVVVKNTGQCTFSYSEDGKSFVNTGTFIAKEGKWIGARIGLFATREIANNDGGRLDVDWFRIEK